jgi:hypothetical protein
MLKDHLTFADPAASADALLQVRLGCTAELDSGPDLKIISTLSSALARILAWRRLACFGDLVAAYVVTADADPSGLTPLQTRCAQWAANVIDIERTLHRVCHQARVLALQSLK